MVQDRAATSIFTFPAEAGIERLALRALGNHMSRLYPEQDAYKNLFTAKNPKNSFSFFTTEITEVTENTNLLGFKNSESTENFKSNPNPAPWFTTTTPRARRISFSILNSQFSIAFEPPHEPPLP